MTVRVIHPPQAAELLAGEDPPVLLDVRTPGELARASVDGAVAIPMNEIARRVGELDPERPVIVMCHHGVRSMQVALWLDHRGFESVANLLGGIDGWSRTVDPSIPRY